MYDPGKGEVLSITLYCCVYISAENILCYTNLFISNWSLTCCTTEIAFFFVSSVNVYMTFFCSICVCMNIFLCCTLLLFSSVSVSPWRLLNFHLILSSYWQNTIFSTQMSAAYIKSNCMARDTALRVNRIEEFSVRNIQHPWYPWFWYRVR